MNELYVSDCYIYFKTKKGNCADAIHELLNACDAAGIEITVDKAVLRDENDNDIDE